jgi:alkyl sulfatase BDS1-like metallo-beta-lactamase superfamily hydrolase
MGDAMWSFESDGSKTVTRPTGAHVHQDHAAQSDVLAKNFYEVRPGVWNFVGNGLSNQTFVEGPDGIIAIDTGESIEEMAAALRELRRHTSRPIAAVIYTHFHYIEGTRAILDEGNCVLPLPIFGHPKIAHNRIRTTTEIAPAYVRGLVEQFAIFMPLEGPDANENIGLGFHFRNPEHAPFTPGHVACTTTFSDGDQLVIAGLHVHVTFAPSDADDSVTLSFPDLDLAVHNVMWPTLFNVFAIRGEEYRDPQILIRAVDHLIGLSPQYLVGTHGPPVSGRDDNLARLRRYRDSLSFLWDQTVRGINKGWTTDELAERVRLPDLFNVDYLTSERYGVAEHHVRQIHNGLRGWFDGDEAKLFPLPSFLRHARLIAELGGRVTVRNKVREAIAANDLRWATELATWLVRSEEVEQEDRELLAKCLRTIGERTPSANIRNWCITRARHLDGTTPMTVMYQHRFNDRATGSLTHREILDTLRVLVDPDVALNREGALTFVIEGESINIELRNCVSVINDDAVSQATVTLSRDTLNKILSNKTSLSSAISAGTVDISGDSDFALTMLAVYEVDGFRS